MAVIRGAVSGGELVGTTLQDQITGLSGDDTVHTLEGGDVVFTTSGNDVIFGGAGNDYLDAGSGNDRIYDGAGNDFVNGGSGDDTVVAGSGDDVYVGGSGVDTIDFSTAQSGIVADMSKGTSEGASSGVDSFQGFEKLIGTAFDDVIKGSRDADVINGGDGNDVIRGFKGADILTGGDGRDTFLWKMTDVIDENGNLMGVDIITDFQSNDTLDLTGLVPKGTHSNIDDYVKLTDTKDGTMVQVNIEGKLVDVALLQGLHTGGALASAWASDDLVLPTYHEPQLLV